MFISGSISSATNSQATPFKPMVLSQTGYNKPFAAQFNISVQGTFVATYQIVRSIDGGITWGSITSLGTPYSFTGPLNETFSEIQNGALYAISVTSYTSGTLLWVMGQ
jgi:hypothetical protein